MGEFRTITVLFICIHSITDSVVPASPTGDKPMLSPTGTVWPLWHSKRTVVDKNL